MASWRDFLGNWRHDAPVDPDPERNRRALAWAYFEWRQGLIGSEGLEDIEPIAPPEGERPARVQGPPAPPVGINSSYEILVEVEESLGLAWYEELTETIAPWAIYVKNNPKWSDPPRLAYWVSPTGLYLHDQAPQNLIKILVQKRVLWYEHIGLRSNPEAWQICSSEFDNLTFGIQSRHCDLCGRSFRPFSSIIEFAQSNPWQLLNNRRFCSQACRHESKWQDNIRKGMKPDAIFDTTVTRDSIWKRFGPHCYLCGFEVFYDQPDLSLRNKSKAWKARWGDVDKYDVNRKAVVEHVIPRSKGGSHTWENVQIACSRCNLQKGDEVIYLSDDDDS